jgi:hypothetical protein
VNTRRQGALPFAEETFYRLWRPCTGLTISKMLVNCNSSRGWCSGNAMDWYSGSTRFESRSGHKLLRQKFLWGPSFLQENATTYLELTTTLSFEILSSSQFDTHTNILCCIVEIRDGGTFCLEGRVLLSHISGRLFYETCVIYCCRKKSLK